MNQNTIMSFSISSKKRTKKQSYHRSYYQDKNRISNRFFGGFSKLIFCLVAMTMLTSRHLLFGRTPSTQVLVSAFVARTPWNFNQQQQQLQLQQNLLPLDSSNIIVANKNHRCFVSSTINYARSQDVDVDDEIGDTSSYSKTITGYKLPKITWYPGHIARAERQLSEILKSVDVLIEVRDGRAPKATAHPMVGQWAAGKPRIVVLTHCDAVPSPSIVAWQKAYDDYGAGRWDESSVDKQVKHTAQQRRRENKILDPKYDNNNDDDILQKVESVIYVNAKVGKGIPALIRTIHKAGTYVHERRARRELNPRSLRVGVLGFPNVGKSTLINKLLGGKKRAKTANTPGVTRSLQWIRVGFKYQSHLATNNNDKSFELLDSPGIIPSSIPNQRDALLLAACNSIGDASYDNQAVAAHLCEWVKSLHLMGKAHLTVPKWREICKKRYAGFDPLHPRKYHDGNNGEMITRLPTGEDFLHYVADNTSCNGDLENAARKILQDFRSGRWGPAALQLAPESREDEGEADVVIQDLRNIMQNDEEVDMITSNIDYNEVTQERAEQAVKTAKELGLELPPMVSSTDNDDEDENESASVKDSEVGKGLFDGW